MSSPPSKPVPQPASAPDAAGTRRKKKSPDEEPREFDETDALLAEIEEDLRAEQFQAFFTRYGAHIAAVVISVIVVVAGYQYWLGAEQKTDQQQAVLFEEAVDASLNGNLDAALAGFQAVTATSPEGYGLFARFSQAGTYISQDDLPAALGVLEGLATDSSVPAVFRDLATISYVQHALSADSPDLGGLQARLAPLSDPANVFSAFAAELQAAITLQGGDLQGASSQFAALADDVTAPSGVRERARQVREALSARTARDGSVAADDSQESGL